MDLWGPYTNWLGTYNRLDFSHFCRNGRIKLIIGKFDNRCVSQQIYIKHSKSNYPLKLAVFLCTFGIN